MFITKYYKSGVEVLPSELAENEFYDRIILDKNGVPAIKQSNWCNLPEKHPLKPLSLLVSSVEGSQVLVAPDNKYILGKLSKYQLSVILSEEDLSKLTNLSGQVLVIPINRVVEGKIVDEVYTKVEVSADGLLCDLELPQAGLWELNIDRVNSAISSLSVPLEVIYEDVQVRVV